MSNQPQIQVRAAQHYAGIRATVPMDGISAAVDAAYPELFGWLARGGTAPAGAPIIRYLVVDMAGELELEMGVPVAQAVTGSGRIQPGVLPAGRYAVLRHTGPYDGLVAATAALQEWALAHRITFDTWNTPRGTAWRARAEHYLTNPAAEPDPATWQTDVACLLREP